MVVSHLIESFYGGGGGGRQSGGDSRVVRSAAVVLVVVVGSVRPAAICPVYPYPFAQTKYELSFILSGMRAQVSILQKCNQTQHNSL